MLQLYSVFEVQQQLAVKLRSMRKAQKMSRRQLAQRSTVPESTIKKFELTGQISLRQLLLLWQSMASLGVFIDLARVQAPEPKSIEEVLRT